jgi:MFS family permease
MDADTSRTIITMEERGAGRTTASPDGAGAGRLRNNRDFRRLLSGQAVSLLGDAVFDTTVVLWVAVDVAAGHSWAPLAVGTVLSASALPTVVLGPLAGVYTDRWDRRRVMLAADAVRAVLVSLLALLPSLWSALAAPARLAAISAIVAATSIATQFFNPARFAVFGGVVPDSQRERAAGLSESLGSLAGIVGPPIAAPLLFTAGVRWGLLVDAASFLVSYLAVRGVRQGRGAAGTGPLSLRREFLAGLRLFAASRRLRTMLTTLVLVTMGGGAVNALNVFFVTRDLHAPARLFGLLEMALGAGAVLGALATAVLGPRLPTNRVYAYGIVLTGVGFVAYSRAPSFPVALVLMLLIGVPAAGLSAMVGPMVLRSAPREFAGRMIAILRPAIQLAGMVSVLMATWLAGTVLSGFHASVAGLHFTAIGTIILASGVLVAAGGCWAVVVLAAPQAPGS